MNLYLLIEDNDVSEAILKYKTYCELKTSDAFFDEILIVLINALQETDLKSFEIVSDLHETITRYKKGLSDKYVSIRIVISSLKRIRMNDIYGYSAMRINDLFKEKYPQYPHLECFCYSLTDYDTHSDHLFLFFTPNDLRRDEESGDLDKMIDEAYEFVKAEDTYGYFTEESYRKKSRDIFQT